MLTISLPYVIMLSIYYKLTNILKCRSTAPSRNFLCLSPIKMERKKEKIFVLTYIRQHMALNRVRVTENKQ